MLITVENHSVVIFKSKEGHTSNTLSSCNNHHDLYFCYKCRSYLV